MSERLIIVIKHSFTVVFAIAIIQTAQMDALPPTLLDDLNTCTLKFDWSMTAGHYCKNP